MLSELPERGQFMPFTLTASTARDSDAFGPPACQPLMIDSARKDSEPPPAVAWDWERCVSDPTGQALP